MLYMVIEKFRKGITKEIYIRLDLRGRRIPAGLKYIDSWIDDKVQMCFQLKETENIKLLSEWISNWSDLADFEIVPVITSKDASAKMNTD